MKKKKLKVITRRGEWEKKGYAFQNANHARYEALLTEPFWKDSLTESDREHIVEFLTEAAEIATEVYRMDLKKWADVMTDEEREKELKQFKISIKKGRQIRSINRLILLLVCRRLDMSYDPLVHDLSSFARQN